MPDANGGDDARKETDSTSLERDRRTADGEPAAEPGEDFETGESDPESEGVEDSTTEESTDDSPNRSVTGFQDLDDAATSERPPGSPTDGDADPGSESGADTWTEETTIDGESVEVTVAEQRPSADARDRPGDHDHRDRAGGHDHRDGSRQHRAESESRSEADLEREILDPEERIGPGDQYCYECGAIFDARADTCPDCGNPFPDQADPKVSTRKNPQISAGLSVLIPGLGHLYNEQFLRAAVAFFGTVGLVAAIAIVGLVLDVLVTVVTLGTLSVLGTAILILAVLFGWLFPVSITAWDAYGQAKKLNGS